jgi:hypothetical protein
MSSSIARSADALVDTIGVNTHFGYTDKPYFSRFAEVKAKLGALGVRHIRDGADEREEIARNIRNVCHSFGIRVLQGVGPRVASPTPWQGKLDIGQIDRVLRTIKTRYGACCEAVEGPNEYDVTHNNPRPDAADTEVTWPATLRAYTEALWRRAQGDPFFRARPVLAPPLAHAANAPKVGDLSPFLTAGNMHPYPGGWHPHRSLEDYNLTNTRTISSTKPVWAGETGYHNAMAQKPGGHNAAPEAVTAKYGPRLVAEYFRLGIPRAYFYEFLDEGTNPAEQEDNFGLIRHDLSEKGIYQSLQATIALLKDPAPAGARPFTPAALDYRLDGNLAEVRQILLQKRDGRFYLLVWQEVPSYDVPTRTLLHPAPRPLTLRLARPARAARLFQPTASGTRPVATFTGQRALRLSVPDHLLIVELR